MVVEVWGDVSPEGKGLLSSSRMGSCASMSVRLVDPVAVEVPGRLLVDAMF